MSVRASLSRIYGLNVCVVDCMEVPDHPYCVMWYCGVCMVVLYSFWISKRNRVEEDDGLEGDDDDGDTQEEDNDNVEEDEGDDKRPENASCTDMTRRHRVTVA